MSTTFFATLPHPALPVLADLREQVLTRSTTRCPKWKFRLAEDLVVQIQPRPVVVISPGALARGIRQLSLLFHGLAVQGDVITADDFTSFRHGSASWRVTFELFAEDEPEMVWSFRARGARGRRGVSPHDWVAYRERIRSALTPERCTDGNLSHVHRAK